MLPGYTYDGRDSLKSRAEGRTMLKGGTGVKRVKKESDEKRGYGGRDRGEDRCGPGHG